MNITYKNCTSAEVSEAENINELFLEVSALGQDLTFERIVTDSGAEYWVIDVTGGDSSPIRRFGILGLQSAVDGLLDEIRDE